MSNWVSPLVSTEFILVSANIDIILETRSEQQNYA